MDGLFGRIRRGIGRVDGARRHRRRIAERRQVVFQSGTVVVLAAVAVAAPQLLALLLAFEDVDAVVAVHGAFPAVEEPHAVALVVLERHQARAVRRADPLGQGARDPRLVPHDFLEMVEHVLADLWSGGGYREGEGAGEGEGRRGEGGEGGGGGRVEREGEKIVRIK